MVTAEDFVRALFIVVVIAVAGTAHADRKPGPPACQGLAACTKACTKRNAEACWQAGVLSEPTDANLAGDLRKARTFFDRACTLKLVRACFALAHTERAIGGKRAGAAAAAALRRAVAIEHAACIKRDAAACDRIVAIYVSRFDAPDFKNATAYRERACRIRTNAPCPPPCQDDAPAAQAAQQAATAMNERRFADELARQKLVPTQLAIRKWSSNMVMPGDRPQSWKLDTVTELRLPHQQAVRVIVGRDSQPDCRGVDQPAEYVRRGDDIYRVQRAPKTTSTQVFSLCGCGPLCGGAMPAIWHLGYELPPGATYRGPITIAYDIDDVRITYKDAGRCAQPP